VSVGEEREVEDNGGEEREGKEMDGCPLTSTPFMSMTSLSILTHQSLEISVCPPCNLPFCVPFYLILSQIIN
jgi:hypothetical protein